MVTTPAPTKRFHALDLWRGLVSLWVVLEHAGVALWGLPAGPGLAGVVGRAVMAALKLHVGTALFFVMSGYCIAASIDSSRRKGERPLGFLARRLWRIFPPYWVALLGFVAVVAGLDAIGLEHYHRGGVSHELSSPGELDAAQWLGNLTLTEGWRPLVAGSEAAIYTKVAWSLCYQEQFYLVCVLALMIAPSRFHRALAVVTGLILAFRVAAWDSGFIHRMQGTFPIYWQEFAVGLALYARLSLPTTAAVRRGIELALVALVGIGLAESFVSTTVAAGFGLLLIGLHRWDLTLGGLRWLDPLRACGRRSYSLYLVHLPVVMVLNARVCEAGLEGFWPRFVLLMPAGLLASVAMAWAFHWTVERHFLRWPGLGWLPRWRPSASRLSTRFALAAGLVAVLTLTAGLAAPAKLARSSREVADRPALQLGGGDEGPDGWVGRHESLVAEADLEAPRVVFLGDSIFDFWKEDLPSWAEAMAPLDAVNLGISGDQTQHLLWRVEHGAVATMPDVAVLLIGTNNLSAGMGDEETARGVAAVVAAIRERSPRTRVLLLGLLPRHLTPIDPIRQRIGRVNARLARLDDGEHVRFLDAGSCLLAPDGQIAPGLMPDSLHPSPDGYRALSRAIVGPLRKLLGSGARP